MNPRCFGTPVLRVAGSGLRLTGLRRTEDRHGVLAPSRAGSRPDIGWPLPKNFVPARIVTIGLVNKNTTTMSISVVRPRV